jgi:hypothetical protein
MRAAAVAVTTIATLALAPAAAPAATTRKATDHIAGLAFSLQGKRLTLTITPKHRSAKEAAGPILRGRVVSVSCGTDNASGHPNSKLVARGTGRWGRKQTTRAFRLSRDVAASADWCLVSAGGRIAGYVDLALGTNPREGTDSRH